MKQNITNQLLTSGEIKDYTKKPMIGQAPIVAFEDTLASDDQIWTITINKSIIGSCLKNFMISPTQFINDCFNGKKNAKWKNGEGSIAILFLYSSKIGDDYIIQGINETNMINVYCPRKINNIPHWSLTPVIAANLPEPSLFTGNTTASPIDIAKGSLSKGKANGTQLKLPKQKIKLSDVNLQRQKIKVEDVKIGDVIKHPPLDVGTLPTEWIPPTLLQMPYSTMQYLPVNNKSGIAYTHYDPKENDPSTGKSQNITYFTMTDILIAIIMNPFILATMINKTDKLITYNGSKSWLTKSESVDLCSAKPVLYYGDSNSYKNNINNLRIIYQVPKDFATGYGINSKYTSDKANSNHSGKMPECQSESEMVPAGSQCLKTSGTYTVVNNNAYITIDGIVYNVW